MRVDVEGAVAAARFAAGFDWTWTRSDVESFTTALGWHVAGAQGSAATISTDLTVARPEAVVAIFPNQDELRQVGQDVRWWVVFVSDVDSHPNARAAMVENFAAVRAALVEHFGEPDRDFDGTEIGWELPKLVLFLASSTYSVTIQFVNPTYQAWADEPEDDD